MLPALGGCASNAVRRIYYNPYPQAQSLAVTVFRNESGSPDIDEMIVTDKFYTELQQIEGFEVIPVDRVINALNELGMAQVENATDAMTLADHLSVDGVIVGAITQYDPYSPPLVGMAVQLYSRHREPVEAKAAAVDAGDLARRGQPFAMETQLPLRPSAGVVRIIDARQNATIRRIKKYARQSNAGATPYGWKKYTTRLNYLRFVAHEIIGELLAQQESRNDATVVGD